MEVHFIAGVLRSVCNATGPLLLTTKLDYHNSYHLQNLFNTELNSWHIRYE
jgi:hypothetical protein